MDEDIQLVIQRLKDISVEDCEDAMSIGMGIGLLQTFKQVVKANPSLLFYVESSRNRYGEIEC